jgi:hypothetical protein
MKINIKTNSKKMNRNHLSATRNTCRQHCGEGGCIPLNVRILFTNVYHIKYYDQIFFFLLLILNQKDFSITKIFEGEK